MACALTLYAGTFQGLVEVWRIAYDGIKFVLWLVVLQCYVMEGYAVVPGRVAEIGCSINDGVFVYFDGGESGLGKALCHHECEYAGARAYVQNAAAAMCHSPQQVAVGADLHPGMCLVDAELAETKTFTMYHGQWTMDNGRWTMDDVRWTMYDVRCTMYDVRWTMYDGQWTMYDGRCTMYDGRCTMYDGRFMVWALTL